MNELKQVELLKEFNRDLSDFFDKKVAGGSEFWSATSKDNIEVSMMRFMEGRKLTHHSEPEYGLLNEMVDVINDVADENSTNGLPLSESFTVEHMDSLIPKVIASMNA